MATFCTNCGTRRNEGARFCGRCGRPFASPPGRALPQGPCLVVIDGPANLPFADLSHGTVTVGRDSSNSLILSDPGVSRHHASVAFESGQWVVEDLDSRSGTRVNEVAVTRQALRPGDRIRLGGAVLAFQGPGPVAPRPVVPIPPPQRAVAIAAPAAARRGPRLGRWLAAALLIVALCAAGTLALQWSNRPPDPGPGLTPLAAQTLRPSTEPQTVMVQDRVSVTVPGGLLTGPQELTISAMPNPPPTEGQVFEAGEVYDISLGELHEFDQPITVELKVDAGRISGDTPADIQVRLATWDPETGTWSLLPTTVDETRQVAIARLNHLTAVGTKYLAKGYQLLIQDSLQPQVPHFRVIYDHKLDVAMELPERRPGTFDYQNRMVMVTSVEEYAHYVAAEAERTYQAYQRAQLFPDKAEEKIDIIVGDFRSIWGKQADDETHPLGGAVFIRHDHGKLADLRHVVSHEMFHIVQLQQARFRAYSGDAAFWFAEASAEVAACRLAWTELPADPGVPKPTCQMGEGLKSRFLRASLEHRVTGSTTDPDNNHLYHASHFLDYLLNGLPHVGQPGPDVNTRFYGLWSAMMQYLSAQPGKQIDALAALHQWAGRFEFDEAYQSFAAYFLFNTNSPMPTPADRKNRVPNDAQGDLVGALWPDVAEVTGNAIQLPARYSAALWEVGVTIDPANPSRQVFVEAQSALPSRVYLNVYLSGTDNQRADYGTWGGPQPVCRLPSPNGCAITLVQSPSLLSIVAVNTSDQDAGVVVKVSATPDSQPPAVTGKAKCFCEDGTALVCDPSLDRQMDGFLLQVSGWEMSDRVWCYRDCVIKCGCDPDDTDLECAHACICGQ